MTRCRHHVRIQRDGAQPLRRVSGVELDEAAGLVEVEHLPARARANLHARARRDGHPADDPVRRHVHRPQLVTADLLVEHVPARAVGRDREADIPANRCRPQGERLDGPGSEVIWPTTSRLRFWMGLASRRRRSRIRAYRSIRRTTRGRAGLLRLRRHRQVPRVHLLQRCGVVDQDLMPEDVEELSVRREPNREASSDGSKSADHGAVASTLCAVRS